MIVLIARDRHFPTGHPTKDQLVDVVDHDLMKLIANNAFVVLSFVNTNRNGLKIIENAVEIDFIFFGISLQATVIMTQLLIAPMEIMGYTLPEHMLPDISHGKMFCKWLRDVHGVDTDTVPTYLHVFEDGRRVWPKAYPEELLADFRKHFREEWLPNRAIDYFRGRDSEALQFLPRLIASNKPKKLN